MADPAIAVLVLPEAGPLNNIADVATLDAIARPLPIECAAVLFAVSIWRTLRARRFASFDSPKGSA